LIFDPRGNLSLESDPQSIWAAAHPEYFPIELNRASKEQLLSIPGNGPPLVKRIVQMRHVNIFNSIEQLARIGADEKRATPFVLLNGKTAMRQLALL